MLFENKVVLVTGGTRGIGFVTAKAFLDEGAQVIFCGSREESVDKASAKLSEDYDSGKFKGIWPDLLDYDSVEATFKEVAKEYGTIDVLVNNAGIAATEPLEDVTGEMFKKVMDLNVNAVFYCSKAVSEIMKENGGGVILNASSIVSRDGQETGIAYPVSKFAINGLTLSLAKELAKHNIRVNAVGPGITNTDMVANTPKELIEPFIATIPLGRLAEPEDIANAYIFLASDKASYISGQVLYVDGLTRI